MSAKWRRTKTNPKWLNIFKAFDIPKEKRKISHLDGWRIKKRLNSSSKKIPRLYLERGMREPEPLLDILEEKNQIIIVAEFAGFRKDSMRIDVESHKLTLCAEALNRKYYKSLNLPKRVIPNTIRTKYKNGVLEIQLKKAVQEKTLDKVAD